MKQFIILTIFFVTIHIGSTAQNALNYNFPKADKVLREEFFKGNFWTMPTDQNDVCYFQSKSEAKKRAEIKAIPVLRLKDDSGVLNFEPDYSMYMALLFKQKKFLCPIYVNTYYEKQHILKQYVTVGWSPSPGFIKHYLDNPSAWFYLPSITDFVFAKDSKYFVWDEKKSSLRDCTENLIASVHERKITSKFTGIDSIGTDRISKYKISTIRSDSNTLHLFQSDEDSVTIGPLIETEVDSRDKMNRVAVNLGNDGYVVSIHPRKQWIEIETHDHKQIALLVYAPYTNTLHSQLAFNKFERLSKRLLEINVKIDPKKGIEFTPVKSQALLFGQRVRKGKNDYFIIRERMQNIVSPQILRLMAIVIFWHEAFEVIR